MAEIHLYGNTTVPQLALETVLPYLTWLPTAISCSNPDSLNVLLNILLVFAGARTAALLQDIKQHYTPFIDRLNQALSDANQEYFRVQVLQTYLGDWIYRENNQRFIKGHWSHRECGMNLDFVAPGNIDYWTDKKLQKIYLHVFEMGSWTQITGEVVPLKYIETESGWERMNRFMDVKVQLFNHAFQSLGLDFECKWFKETLLDLREVMASDTPRSEDWWRVNRFQVARSVVGHPRFENILAHPQGNWDVIKALFQFASDSSVVTCRRENSEFEECVSRLYSEVSSVISEGVTVDATDLQDKLETLQEVARNESVSMPRSRQQRTRKEAWTIFKEIIKSELKYQVRRRGPQTQEAWPGLECSELAKGYWSSYFSHLGRLGLEVIHPNLRFRIWELRRKLGR